MITIESITKYLQETVSELDTEEKKVLSAKGKDIKLSTDHFLNNAICQFLEKNSSYQTLSEENNEQIEYIKSNGT